MIAVEERQRHGILGIGAVGAHDGGERGLPVFHPVAVLRAGQQHLRAHGIGARRLRIERDGAVGIGKRGLRLLGRPFRFGEHGQRIGALRIAGRGGADRGDQRGQFLGPGVMEQMQFVLDQRALRRIHRLDADRRDLHLLGGQAGRGQAMAHIDLQILFQPIQPAFEIAVGIDVLHAIRDIVEIARDVGAPIRLILEIVGEQPGGAIIAIAVAQAEAVRVASKQVLDRIERSHH